MQQNRRKAIFCATAFLVLSVCGLVVWKLQPRDAQLSTPNNAIPAQPLPSEEKQVPPLVDGTKINWLGVFHDSPVADGLKSFHSNELGISFKYPEDCLLFSGVFSETGVYENFQHIMIGQKNPVLQTIARARAGFAGEGPYMINFNFFYDQRLKIANIMPEDYLKRWLVEHQAQSNFYPEGQGPGTVPAILASTTIDGVSAFRYRNPYGLYESDHVAFVYGDRIVIISTPNDSSIARAVDAVISSLQLK